jgi:hypothetical protein
MHVSAADMTCHLEAGQQPDTKTLSGSLGLLQPIKGVVIGQGDNV